MRRRSGPAARVLLTLSLILLGAVPAGASTAQAGTSATPAGTSTASANAPAPSEPPNLATPEDAVREYLAGVVDADAARILGASAIDEPSEGYRFDVMTERLQTFQPFWMLAPAEYPLFVELNKATRTSYLLGQVRNLVYDLLSDVEIDGQPVFGVDKAWADEFVGLVDPAKLSSLVIAEIRPSSADLSDNPRYLESVAEQATAYGADELTERLVLFYFDGGLYDLGFTLLRYGDQWKVFSQDSPMGGTLTTGTPRPTTIEDYDLQTLGE